MASISGNNKIVLKGDFGQWEEGTLKAAGYPGMNLIMGADTELMGRHSYTPGSSDYVGTGTGITTVASPLKILVEDSLQGKSVDDAWTVDEGCKFYIPTKGDVLQLLVKSGQNLAKGVGVTADSTGKFISDATNAVAETFESTNGALGADTLVRCRVL